MSDDSNVWWGSYLQDMYSYNIISFEHLMSIICISFSQNINSTFQLTKTN